MRWLALIGGMLFLTSDGTAMAQSQSSTQAQQPCAPAETRSATIADIIALGDDAIGHCFSVEGIAVGFWLYADNAARYRLQRTDNDPSSTGATLGLYGRDRGAPPALVTVTGRIDRCQRIFDAVVAEGNVPFISGYCHYYRGLALFGRQVDERGPFTFRRIPLRDAGPLGNLRPVGDGYARDRLMAAAQPFFAALRDRDAARLRGLIAASQQQQESRTEELIAHPAVERWRSEPGEIAVEVFGWQRPADATAQQRETWTALATDSPEAYVCSAPRDFADAGLWPIGRGDTDIVAERRYVCVQLWLPAGRPPSFLFHLGDPGDMTPREP